MVTEVIDNLWGFTTEAPGLEDKIVMLTEAFSHEEMQTFGGCALRLVKNGPFVSLLGSGGACWAPNTAKQIPYEFVRRLADFAQPDS